MEALPIPRDEAAAGQEDPVVRPAPEAKQLAAGVAAQSEGARFSGTAQRLAAPRTRPESPVDGFMASTLEDALNALGGSILLIDGLSPAGIELNSEVPPVVRIRYTFPSSMDTVYLEQRRADTSGITSYDASNSKLANQLNGNRARADSLKSNRNGLLFRLSGTVPDSLLETLVPRIH
jgi:hypothetical protein